MAQTMPDALFGPIVCCSHSNVTYFVNNTIHILQIFSQCTEIYEEKGKTHLGPKQCQMCHLSLFSCCHPPSLLCCIFCKLALIYAIKISLVAKSTKKKKYHSSSAQTMCLASSGPILVISTLCHSPVMYFVNKK